MLLTSYTNHERDSTFGAMGTKRTPVARKCVMALGQKPMPKPLSTNDNIAPSWPTSNATRGSAAVFESVCPATSRYLAHSAGSRVLDSVV